MRTIKLLLLSIPLIFQSCSSQQQYSNEVVKGELGEKINRYFEALEPFGLSGSFLFAQGDSIIFHRAFGHSDRSIPSFNTTKTLFSIGSLTKQFTAAAILKLEAEGKLKTTDSLHRFFNHVPEDKRDIQIHHLLTHTSGLPIYVNESDDFTNTSKEEMFRILWESDLTDKPGQSYEYSNAGYALLAAIVEEVSHQPYERYLRESVLVPAGLRSTGYEQADWSELTEANNYIGEKSQGTFQSRNFINWNLMGNGALLSTTEEMFKWYVALRNKSVLPEAQMTRFFMPFLEDYAYGWEVYDGGEIIEHSGSGSGNNSLILWYPKADIVFIGLSNYAFDGLDMIDYLYDDIDLLLNGEDPIMAPAVSKQAHSIELSEGRYNSPVYGSFDLIRTSSGYRLSTYSQETISFLNTLPKDTFIHENALANRLFSEALLHDSFDLLDSLVQEKDRFERLAAAINRYVDNYGFVEPTPQVYRSEKVSNSMRSLVVVTESGKHPQAFEESFFLSLVWNDEGFGGIGRTLMPYRPVVYYLIPAEKNRIIGYDLYNKHSIELEMESNHEQITVVLDQMQATFSKISENEKN